MPSVFQKDAPAACKRLKRLDVPAPKKVCHLLNLGVLRLAAEQDGGDKLRPLAQTIDQAGVVCAVFRDEAQNG